MKESHIKTLEIYNKIHEEQELHTPLKLLLSSIALSATLEHDKVNDKTLLEVGVKAEYF
jgi:hypothetical protein